MMYRLLPLYPFTHPPIRPNPTVAHPSTHPPTHLPFPQDGYACAVEWENVIAGAMMYGSYLYLFTEFFVRRFLLAPPKAKKL